jgi:FkbM family methyltransferase
MRIDFSSILSTFINCKIDTPPEYQFIWNDIKLMIDECKNNLHHGEYVEINLGTLGSVLYPFYKYKTLTSLDLLSPEDIFLFSRYVKNYPAINQFIDIGANIGLHSLVAKRIGYSVISYEPDPETFSLSKKFFDKNNIEFLEFNDQDIIVEKLSKKRGELLLVQAAVSDFNGFTQFTKILDNPTANHLSGRKMNIYGELLEQTVRVVCIDQLKFEAVIKMDAEGEDAIILQSVLNSESLSGIVYLCDWRSETRQDIYNLLLKNSLSSYNPFFRRKLENINDLPLSKSCDFIEVQVS